jgi:hypothetical protein
MAKKKSDRTPVLWNRKIFVSGDESRPGATDDEDNTDQDVDPRAIVRLEGLGQLKTSTSSGLEPAVFRLIA